jgi:hypothetical protein
MPRSHPRHSPHFSLRAVMPQPLYFSSAHLPAFSFAVCLPNAGQYRQKFMGKFFKLRVIGFFFYNGINSDYNTMPPDARRFIFFETDLNDDGKNEIFVGFRGTEFCGSGGCTALLLSPDGKLITRFTVADYPFIVYSDKTLGWKNLVVRSGGSDRILKWNGTKYPSNPSMQPKYNGLPSDKAPRALWYSQFPYPWFKF